jgi:hypothetical protein
LNIDHHKDLENNDSYGNFDNDGYGIDGQDLGRYRERERVSIEDKVINIYIYIYTYR